MKKLLNKLFEHQTLNREEAKHLLTAITDGSANEAQIVAAISALKMRTVTAEELNGFRAALLEQAVIPDLDGSNAIDVCGTGGDGKNTFNISTLAAIVIAGAGYKVIKHGNYGVSSKVGSSTILEAVGYEFTSDSEVLNAQLNQANICFLHAPLFHPALKRVAPIRRDLGVRTFFNFLGPLVNPVQPAYQLTGVFNLQIMRIYKQILSEERAGFRVIHSLDGYDEVSLTSPFKVASEKQEMILYPEDLKQQTIEPSSLFVGDTIDESANLFTSVLEGNGTTEQNAVVMVNAAIGIQCFDPQKPFELALQEAKESLFKGNAKKALEESVKIKSLKPQL